MGDVPCAQEGVGVCGPAKIFWLMRFLVDAILAQSYNQLKFIFC